MSFVLSAEFVPSFLCCPEYRLPMSRVTVAKGANAGTLMWGLNPWRESRLSEEDKIIARISMEAFSPLFVP